ncbi:Eco57I restriction-modification methylase domain-containing protein [Bacteroides togonis]|uniref:Eco57I restriction-modification methylase domain-containing protein n=1 Tax=Bacteroides togonis TaxID=1917883 RepID=UPI00094B1D91|nr:TaqI-like C-terminal specificity domain-containing protein [Bacteroides togonis]
MEFNKAYSRQEFVRFLQNSFLPEDFVPSEEEVWFRTKMTYSTEAVKLGTCPSLELVVYEVKHRSKHNARVSLSKEAFRMLADEMKDRALVVFVPEDSNENYRFSLIEITLDAADDSARVTKRYSNPRRYSYFLGEGIAYYTPNKYLNEKGRVASKEDLLSRFSVEVLTKEFYQELSDWYAWAIKIIRFPNNIDDKDDDAKFNNEGAIRLITRLIFVWFLKQRHLIPEEFFDESYLKENLLKNFKPYQMGGLLHDRGEVKYYTAILQNLFFAMLNSPITAEGSKDVAERHFRKLNEQGKPDRSDYDNNKLMRYESYFKNPQLFVDLANRTVPFLNGGLFDCLDEKDKGIYYDGFSDSEKSMKSLYIPDFLFFIPETGVDLSIWYNDKRKKAVKVRGLIQILKRYNFTVEENTPFDKEVSLDPELLGKVFENLLASFNPETQTTARKQTGSFYTPREIVQYMVDESLVAHLKRTVGEELEPQYRQLMQYSDDDVELTAEQRKSIMQSLYNCKILDPACGSGAFPMGILQQMVHILNRIDPGNKQWKEMMRAVAINKTSEAYFNASDDERKELIADIERSFDESINRPDYARKLYLIENCIYGVDIQPIAIQISKLRFFISLVVDQNTNADPTDNFGIRPLPNLEAKFVAANTLIGLIKKDASLFDSAEIKAKENELKIAKHKIFGAKTVKTKRKYKNIVNDLRQEIADMLYANGAVGNDEARQLASWDMFDQNASSPFFDPEWMFGVKDGFDIVIGNPPYISYYSNTGSQLTIFERKTYVSQYKSIAKSNDRINSMNLMIERGLSLLCLNGNLSYIVNKTFSVLPSYINVREYIIKNYKIEYIVQDLSPFEAIVDCIVIGIKNYSYNTDYKMRLVSPDLKTSKSASISFVRENRLKEFIVSDNITIIKKIEKQPLKLCNILIVNRGMNIGGCFSSFLSTTCKGKLYRRYLPGTANISYYTYRWEESDGWAKFDQQIERELKLAGKTLALGDPSRYDKPRLFIPESSQTLVAAYCDEEYYSGYGLMVGTAVDTNTKSLKYACALLNSKLLTFYALRKEILRKGNKATPHVGVKGLSSIPVPQVSKEQQSLIANIVDKIIDNKKFSNEIAVSTYVSQIDSIIYKLYELTYDEILIVDPQTPIIRKEYEKA